ncbi:MAG TPA: hypothetical protein VMZ69_01480, partial [Saprospiraceae bacterium]|nr:hypothetical protein [Saprospiraceae bacterium]
MPGILRYPFLGILIVLLNHSATAQTLFDPGNVAVLGYVNDLGSCGYGPESDEISFVFFQDLTNTTNFYLTDNGWEAGNPGFWGDSEGTLRIFRTGGTIPAGTVITLQCRNVGPVWDYRIISPDNNWAISNINTPGGQFNLESGGDQFYFLQDGDWDNQGGGMDMATFDGTILYGFNTEPSWSADGSTNQSNLHPDVLPCNHNEGASKDFYKYTLDFSMASQFEWFKRIHDPTYWTSYLDCASYLSSFPIYGNGFSINIHPQDVGAWCFVCDVCSGTVNNVIFNLPPGIYDIVYTDGTDTFELLHVQHLAFGQHLIIDTTTFTVISIVETNGCPIPGPWTSATYNAPHHNPGTHYEFSICPDYGLVQLAPLLGPHDPGGVWYPPLDPIFGLYYSSFWGPGTYHYVFANGSGPGGGCPPDTASVTVHWIDTSGITIEFGCDINGTPTDITDDRTTITLNFQGVGLGPTYTVTPLYYGVPTGTVTPIQGITGVPTTFTLGPGSATTTNWTLLVADEWGFFCEYKFPVIPPGWCSDPCDHEMTAFLSGDEATCPNSCPDNPATIFIDVEGGNLNVTGGDVTDYSMDFSISSVGYPTWNFTDSEIQYIDQIEICISNVPAPVYDEVSGSLILPMFLTGHEVVFTLINLYDFYGCTANVNAQHYLTIYPLPTITTTNLKFCNDVAFDVDLTEYDLFISPFLDVSWYDGNPLQGGDELNAAGTDLHNVVQLWALVSDDYCENSIQVPFMILPLPQLDSVPPQQICQGGSIALQSISLNDLGNSMATYTYHSGLPPDTSNMLDPLFFIPADSTTIYVHATAGMCHDTLPIEIDVQDYPVFTLLATPCDLLLNTYSVVFTTTADSIHSSVGTVVNNPTGQDQVTGIPENVNIIIELLNSTSLCKDTVSITAPNCNCPSIAQPSAAQPSYTICEGDAIPVFSVTVDPGMVANWYDVPSGGVPILTNSLTYQPANSVSANYYAESLDPASNCYSIRTEIPFVVNPVADLQALADQVLCETETINFNTFIPSVLNGVNGTGGWFNLLTNQSVTGTIQPQNGDSWYYLFSSNPGNCPSTDTVSAVVNPIPTIDLFAINCDENTLTFELLFTTEAEDIAVSGGTLGHTVGTDSFSLGNIPFDTDIQFVLQNISTGCSNSFTQLAPDCSCPALLQQTDDEVCSNSGSVDLSTFEGFGVSGNWQLVSSPGGGNPATLAGKILQIQNKDAGLYTLRFIRSVILTDCVDTAFFNLTLHTSPFADAG